MRVSTRKPTSGIETHETTPPPPAAARAVGGHRSPAGTNYGDYAPGSIPSGMADPSRGAEMERDILPADARFDRAPNVTPTFEDRLAPPGSAEPASASQSGPDAGRATRIRNTAFQRYQQRGDAAGDAIGDWLAAESEVDAGGGLPRAADQRSGAGDAPTRYKGERD